jgi:hypothetical protein
MRSALRLPMLSLAGLVLGLALLSGCSILEDNGTHLAYALERGASDLRASTQEGAVIRYETLDGPAQAYYVEITPSGSAEGRWSSYLVVSGKTSGGTSYHNRFVFVPQRLYLQKDQGGPTEVILRKHAGRIEVVGLR